MAALVDLLRFLSIFLTGIEAGTLLALLVGLVPAIARYPPGEGLKVHQTVEPLLDRYAPPCTALGAVAAVLTLVLDRDAAASVRLFTTIGLIGSLSVGVVSAGFSDRIMRRFTSFTTDPLPPEYPELRRRWDRLHAARTVLGLLAFGAYTIAALVG